MKDEMRKLNHLALKCHSDATLLISELEMRPTMIIPFCVMMLENSIKIFRQGQRMHADFASEYPDDPLDEARKYVTKMFEIGFGKDFKLHKSPADITAMVSDMLKESHKKFLEGDDKNGKL